MRDDLTKLVEHLRAIGPISPRLQVEIITEALPDFELEELAEALHALGASETADRIRRARERQLQRHRAAQHSASDAVPGLPTTGHRRPGEMAYRHIPEIELFDEFLSDVERSPRRASLLHRCAAFLFGRRA